jgi:predicted deacylase
MARQTERIPLWSPAPGTRQELVLHRYGQRGARPKAYLQASIHADETPAMMAVHHLLPHLERADREGRIRGEIVVVPYANPLGLAQVVNETLLGRYELRGGGNFNRNWPNLTAPLAAKLDGKLTEDGAANVALVRQAVLAVLGEIQPRKELDVLRLVLAREALCAELVLDLHCDDDSLAHWFTIPQQWPATEDVAAEVGVDAVLLAEDSGGGSFDEFASLLWLRLRARFPDHPLPAETLSGTVEFRGQGDVSDELGAADGAALYRVLARRGFVEDKALPPRPALRCQATDLTATESLKAPVGGIAAYRVKPGDRVRKGDLVCEMIDPAAPPGTPRTPVFAGTDGLVLSRKYFKFLSAGAGLAKIVGTEPLPGRSGYLLED